jgi:neutral ceramidase
MKTDGAEKMRTPRILLVVFLLLSTACIPTFAKPAKQIRVAAAAAEIISDDSMEIAGGISPGHVVGQEGKLRASAIVIEANTRVCIVSCDVLVLQRDILDDVCRKIEAEENIPFENILITSTHTHHAPTTVTVHGYKRDKTFCLRVKDAIVSAVHKASRKLKNAPPASMYFRLGQESTVGQNSRLLLKDGTIYWVGSRADALRPTGPFDPELPVLAFKRPDGTLEAILFNHSSHNIGVRSSGRSPAFYGLAAQELEQELGGTTIFIPGAFGSTHVLSLSMDERILRIKNAVKDAFSKAEKRQVPTVISEKRQFRYRVRNFDEDAEEKAVSYYCNKRLGGNPEDIIKVFRNMRKELAKHQGELRNTWLHVILIGDIAFVGVPGECFGRLGTEIKRRSPFRYTYVIALANDYIGYIPDKQAYDLGGYQVWTGFHSLVERGTGEAIVDEAVRILEEIKAKKQM